MTDEMRDEYDFTDGERGKYAESDEDLMIRIRRRLGAGPADVAYVAHSIVDRLMKQAGNLAQEVKFKCERCKDIGAVREEDGWKPCICQTEKAPKKRKVFRK